MATVRINNGRDNYLDCSISDNASDYAGFYDNSDELMSEYKDQIIEECKEKGYNEYETEKVLSHYAISWSNWGGNWGSEL